MWRARPVFISSNFADMQAECDHLFKFVLPELEERLRKRRHNLEWVDLRMGVATASLAEDEARELQVLKVCLSEVRRCRPFLIVLLGDRYGSMPPADRITAAAIEESFDAEVAGRSVTNLEISFGVLADPEQQPRSFFYFREPLPYAEMPAASAALYADAYDLLDNVRGLRWYTRYFGRIRQKRQHDPQAAQRADRLAMLKRRITDRMPNRVRRYAVGWDRERQRIIGLESWDRQVLEDIWTELEAETAAATLRPDPSWQQAERDALGDYAEDSARDFVGRQSALARLLEQAQSAMREGTPSGLCVIGEPGSGKSTIFGELLRRLRTTDAIVLAHAAGASLRSSSVETMHK